MAKKKKKKSGPPKIEDRDNKIPKGPKWKDTSMSTPTDDMFTKARFFDKDGYEIFMDNALTGRDEPDLEEYAREMELHGEFIEEVDMGKAKEPAKFQKTKK